MSTQNFPRASHHLRSGHLAGERHAGPFIQSGVIHSLGHGSDDENNPLAFIAPEPFGTQRSQVAVGQRTPCGPGVAQTADTAGDAGRLFIFDRADFDKWWTGEPNSGCWLWLGDATSTGYGRWKRDGKRVRAHRISYTIHHGPIPKGLCVLHKCDTPLCVNPHHLFLGTVLVNNTDKVAKGRQARGVKHSLACAKSRGNLRGESHGSARLTEAEVLAIRASPRSERALGQQYGISSVMAGKIKRRQRWAHL